MSRSLVTTSGAIVYRTKPMFTPQADSFAKCLQANALFQSVTVSEPTKTGKAFVMYQPANTERQADLYQSQYDARLIRAYEQAGNYFVTKNEDKVGVWYVLNLTSGEVYEVDSMGGCTCPDYQFRACRAGMPCKHSHILQCHSDNGMIGKIWEAPHALAA